MKITPLKRLGQNFLIDNNIIEKIIKTINPGQNDHIIEIGPGQGALTKFLAEKAGSYIAIELDPRASENLRKELNIEVLNQDFLKFDIESEFTNNGDKTIKIVGNIPYNITTPIIEKLINNSGYITSSVLMVQAEAADRLTSGMGCKSYNAVNLLLNYFALVKKEFMVSPNSFYPKPRVNSAILSLNFVPRKLNRTNKAAYIELVKKSFANRRKMLKNSGLFRNDENCNFEPFEKLILKRPDQLTAEDYLNILECLNRKVDNGK